jgi:hypothetical protein
LFFVAAFVAVGVEVAAKKDAVTKQGILQLDCAFSGFPGFRVSGPAPAQRLSRLFNRRRHFLSCDRLDGPWISCLDVVRLMKSVKDATHREW